MCILSPSSPSTNSILTKCDILRIQMTMTLQSCCCTCASILDADVKSKPSFCDPSSEKDSPLPSIRRLSCCSRCICGSCQRSNPRFQTYCPFCQISSVPSALPKEGLRLPPSYTSSSPSLNRNGGLEKEEDSAPPSYYDSISIVPASQRRINSQITTPPEATQDTIHFLSVTDTLASLSLSYKTPIPILRQHNNLYTDNLLSARKYIRIPASHYNGPSLSTPPDPEEEERKTKLRRWMVATKCADYSVATLYLKGCDYNLESAIEAFKADEEWEKRNPLKGNGKRVGSETGRRKGALGRGGTLVGQLL